MKSETKMSVKCHTASDSTWSLHLKVGAVANFEPGIKYMSKNDTTAKPGKSIKHNQEMNKKKENIKQNEISKAQLQYKNT